jgi:uncharacterized protein YcbK (DUF882 family)
MLLGLAAAFAAPALVRPRAASAAVSEDVRRLKIENMHTGERLDITYYSDGLYQLGALSEIDHFMRDWRNDKEVRFDPEALDLLVNIGRKLEVSEPMRVLCGYRSPETNAMLRKHDRRVAKNSLHMRGMAIDFYCPSRSIKQIRNAAKSLKGGGVGYYPRSGFVHVDTGPVRYW